MNFTKSISSKSIIAKVYRDLKPDNSSFQADAIDWIGEALEFIGVHSALEKTFEDVNIVNHRASLPTDLHNIYFVEYNGCPMIYGTDVRLNALDVDPNALTNPKAFDIISAIFKTDLQDAELKFKEVSSLRGKPGEQCYTLNQGVIRTSIPEGNVRVHYARIPIDKDCYPMIPDNATVKEAITWYILRQMLMSGLKNPVFSWQMADAKWEEYCGKAQNDLMFPSIDKVESFRRMWVTMIPNVNAYNTFLDNY